MNPEQQNPAPAPVPTQTPVSNPVATPSGVNPGKSMAIGAIILGFVVASPIGLILSIVALQKSRKAGFKNNLALAFIIVFALATPLWILWSISFIGGLAAV